MAFELAHNCACFITVPAFLLRFWLGKVGWRITEMRQRILFLPDKREAFFQTSGNFIQCRSGCPARYLAVGNRLHNAIEQNAERWWRMLQARAMNDGNPAHPARIPGTVEAPAGPMHIDLRTGHGDELVCVRSKKYGAA